MYRTPIWMLGLALGFGWVGPGLQAAPAPPSYLRIEQSLEQVRAAWQSPQGEDVRRAEGWEAFAAHVEEALQAYASAADEPARQQALSRLVRLSDALQLSTWGPALELRQALDEWLRPRQTLADAVGRLGAAVRMLPPAVSPELQANREHWLGLVDDRLGAALSAYESAESIADRAEALDELRSELDQLRQANQVYPWRPALELHQALAQLFDRPNVEATADLNSVVPFLSQNVVDPGPVYRNGQVSYVTAGPKTGFGLMPSADGIAFYNKQIAYAVTPIRGFHEQVAQDERGRQAARLYYFNATSYNTSESTAVAVIRPQPNGIGLFPSATNNIDAAISATEQPGHGPHVGRTLAAAIGLDKQAIIQQVYEGAIGQIRQQVEQGSADEARDRAAAKQAQFNAQAAQFLVDQGTIAVGPVRLSGVDLASQPTHVWAQGTLTWQDTAPLLRGADFPQPARFAVPEAGVTADVHLSSILTNLAEGFLASPRAQEVNNILIETGVQGAQAPSGRGGEMRQNVAYPDYLEAIERADAAKNPEALAVRVWRPARAPLFGVDRDGNLVIVLRDFKMEVPTPPNARQGGGLTGPPAWAYRMVLPRAQLTLDLDIETPAPGAPVRLRGKVVSFETGPGAEVFALNQPEDAPRRLNAITAAVALGVLRTRIQNQAIDQTLNPPENMQGFAISSISELDPTGWLRVNLVRTR